MTVRDMVRAYLDANAGPQWAVDIIAHVRSTGIKVRASIISGMVLDGSLVRHETTPDQPYAYTIGKRPPPVMTAEQRAERQRGYEAKRSAKRMAERRANGIQARPRRDQPTVKRVGIALVSSHNTEPGESVAEFLARGGKIERLPGFQRDNVFAPRRPTWAANNRMSSS